jgi:hypothetical protein
MHDEKYFSSDPLSATWLGKHLGVRFIDKDAPDKGIHHDYGDYSIQYLYEEFGVQPPYCIHPDSLPLLEKLSEERKNAMKLLGLWPKTEQSPNR